ncbi:MAG: GIY-YIG nuclease family protein [Thermomicrobiales bacterium]|nr:GIY-YIG nuclease family protein [Thermomicrobiales bacterium]
MLKGERKAAVAAYKERAIPAGIYRVRCTATGEVWIGQSPNLEAIRNRLWFTLRMGSHRTARLQQTWRDHGAESFTFEVVEQVSDEDQVHDLSAHLKKRLAHWQSELGAALV